MIFFRFERSIEENIVGKVYPYKSVEIPIHIDSPKLILNRFFEKVDEKNTVTPIYILNGKAKLVDFMPGTATGEIICDKLKKLIESTHPLNMQFIEQTIQGKKGEIGGYWLTNNYGFDYSVIDFQKTVISVMKTTWDEDYQIKVNDEFEFLKLIEETKLPQNIKIFKPIFNADYPKDFFALRYVYNGFSFFCSERFREKLEAEKITGIRYMELDEIL